MKIAIMQLEFIDLNLRKIAQEIDNHFRMEFEITSLYRIGDTGVHGQLPLRGLDLGCKNIIIGNEVCRYINLNWEYDKDRPEKECAVYHDSHIHLQSHPNTRRRN